MGVGVGFDRNLYACADRYWAIVNYSDITDGSNALREVETRGQQATTGFNFILKAFHVNANFDTLRIRP